MTIDGIKEDALPGLQEDTAKLRRMTTGNKELDAVAQILGRAAAALAELQQRVLILEAERLLLRAHLGSGCRV